MALGALTAGLTVALLSLFPIVEAEPLSRRAARPSEGSGGSTRIRLLDRLADAEVEGALREVIPADSLQALPSPRRTRVYEQSFEQVPEGWQLDPSDVVRDGALVLAVERQTPGYTVLVPVEPSTHYRFLQRASRSEVPLVEITAVETAEVVSQPSPRILRGAALREFQRNALAVHRPSEPSVTEELETSTCSLFTTPDTRSVALVVTVHRHPDPSAARPPTRSFDHIALDRYELSAADEVALVAGHDRVEGASREIFGPVIPAGDTRDRDPTASEDAFSFRRAVYAPPGTVLRFPAVSLDAGAELRVSYTLAAQSRVPSAASFAIFVESEGARTEVWSNTFESRDARWGWAEASVDLSAYAGQRARLVFETSAPGPGVHPVWGHPTLEAVRAPAERVEPRHVILIAVDTLRADRLGAYGYPRPTSPNLDALSRDAVRFENTIAQANWTCPSFASLFTGVSVSRHGVYGHSFESPLPEAFDTLAERFRAAGWVTEAIAFKTPLYRGGYDQGYDRALIVPRREVRAAENVERALAWMDRADGDRQFLFLHFNDPHQPFMQPEPFDSRFGHLVEGDPVQLPWYVPSGSDAPLTPALRAHASDLYDGAIAYVDQQIGIFLDALRERSLYDDALIVFVSDHGEELWEHGHFGHAGRHLYDELVRVPLLIKPPRGSFEPTTVSEQVRGFDLMPTMLELSGIAVPDAEALEASSLVGLMRGDGASRPAFVESSRSTLALRAQGYKYVLSHGLRIEEQLFDLGADPGELTDLAEREPERLAAMRLRVLDYVLSRRPGYYRVDIGPPGELQGEREVYFESDQLRVAQMHGSSPGSEHEPYQAGTLETLVASDAAGAHLFRGRERPQGRARPMDPTQLEALRALGYLGE